MAELRRLSSNFSLEGLRRVMPSKDPAELERYLTSLRHSIAVHLLEAGQGIEYVADHLGHKNIQNTRIYAQITTSLHQEVFAKLERHPKIVRVA